MNTYRPAQSIAQYDIDLLLTRATNPAPGRGTIRSVFGLYARVEGPQTITILVIHKKGGGYLASEITYSGRFSVDWVVDEDRLKSILADVSEESG